MESQTARNSSTPAPERIISNHYDYGKVFQFIETKGKEVYGAKFQLYADDKQVLLQLAAYFLRDEKICDQHKLDLGKGIMLTGPIGCGKTTLMNLMRYLIGNAN